jgi:hypothetical protein
MHSFSIAGVSLLHSCVELSQLLDVLLKLRNGRQKQLVPAVSLVGQAELAARLLLHCCLPSCHQSDSSCIMQHAGG